MGRKQKKLHEHRENLILALLPAFLLAFASSCAVEQEFSGTSHINTSFRLTTPAAMDGKLVIAEAYLKLNRLEVSGSLSGKNNTSLTHPIPAEEPPYKLTNADSSHVNFSVSSRMFDQLELHLFPFTDSYELVYLGGPEETPAPVEEPEQGEHDPADDNAGHNPGEHDDDEGTNDGHGDNNGSENNDGDGDDEGDGNTSDDSDDEDKADDDKKDKDKGKDKDDKKNKDKDGDKHHHDDNGHDDEEKDDDDNDWGDDDDDDRDWDKHEGNKGDDDDRDGGHDHDDDDDDDNEDDDDDDRDDRKSRNNENTVVDLDHFFQNARPGLVVFGIYENNGKTINLILVVTDVDKLSIRARQSDSFSIVLTENNEAQLTFDPDHWFESLTPADIEGGTIQTYQQQDVLFIHPDHNTSLYQALVPRIEGSADLEIKAPGSGAL